MKLTNNHNLPQTFINVLERPTYSKGKSNISATELLNSPRIVQLKRKHWDDIEQDASEMVWALFGTAVHGVLEHGKDENHVVEERIHAKVNNWSISGAIDLQEIGEDGIIISDYKVTSDWAVMNEKDDWHHQLNLYAYLVELVKKQPVKKLQIVAIIRNWSGRDAKTRDGYPQAPIVVIDIPVWSFDKRESYVHERIALHEDAFFDAETGGDVRECTAEEMWEKPTTYAVKKDGGVRAKSVHATFQEATMALPPSGYKIEVREGERTRCASFCQVSQFCNQYQTYLSTKETA